jgi:hypothetical protein
MVEFGDFECPNCKEEAKTLRDNVPSQFATQVHVVLQGFPAGADSSLGQGRGHRRTLYLSPKPGRFLEVS